MFESNLNFTIKGLVWPDGGMVDTTDLKSVPFWECWFKSSTGYQMQRTRFFLYLFFCYCRNQVANCRNVATNRKIFVGNGGFIEVE